MRLVSIKVDYIFSIQSCCQKLQVSFSAILLHNRIKTFLYGISDFAIHQILFDSQTEYANLFNLIHVYVWGPYKHKPHENCAYFLTNVKAKSRATWTYLFADKCKVFHLLCSLFTYVQNHFATAVKILRSDNGSEFSNKSMSLELARLGIVYQTTSPYTTQQG